MAKILVTANQKGGVGKTTLAVHAAWLAAEAGKRVLVVDLDTQANASQTLSGDANIRTAGAGSECFFSDNSLANLMKLNSGIDLLPGTSSLDELDSALTLDSVLAIRDKIRSLDYDLIVIDTPPAVSMRQLAPLLIAHQVVIPMQVDEYSVSGLTAILDTLNDVQNLNPGLEFKVVPNCYQGHSSSQAAIMAGLQDALPPEWLLPALPLRQAVKNGIKCSRPIWKMPVKPAIKQLWKTVLEGVI